jgi:hypothetical protein
MHPVNILKIRHVPLIQSQPNVLRKALLENILCRFQQRSDGRTHEPEECEALQTNRNSVVLPASRVAVVAGLGESPEDGTSMLALREV